MTIFSIEPVADVIIAVGARPLPTLDFFTPMIIASHNLYSDQVKEYTSLSSIAADGFSTTSALYKQASNVFGGAFAPYRILVGKRGLTSYSVNFDVTNSTAYTVNVKVYNTGTSTRYSKDFTYTSDSSATNAEIAAGLAALIEADSDVGGLVAASNSSGVLVVAPTASAPLSVGAVTSNCYMTETASETAASAIATAYESRTDFFYVLSPDQTSTTQLGLAAWAEANDREYFTATSASDVYASGSSDIASQLAALSYNNTIIISTLTAHKDYPDAAAVGAEATTLPGSTDLYAKTLVGSATSNFTETQANYAKAKGASIYINRGGVGWLEAGNAVSGRPLDITKGALWLEATMQQDLFNLIKTQSDLGRKVPMTDAGIAMVDAVMKKRLDIAVKNGFVEEYTTSPPLAEDIPDTDRANRLLANVPFEAQLTGALRSVTVRGYLVI